jgi:hypothetical protein
MVAVTWDSIGRDEYPTCVGFGDSYSEERNSADAAKAGKPGKGQKFAPRKPRGKCEVSGISRLHAMGWESRKIGLRSAALLGKTLPHDGMHGDKAYRLFNVPRSDQKGI